MARVNLLSSHWGGSECVLQPALLTVSVGDKLPGKFNYLILPLFSNSLIVFLVSSFQLLSTFVLYVYYLYL